MFESINNSTTPNWKLRGAAVVVTVALGYGAVSVWRMIGMPLTSYQGELPQISAQQVEIAGRLTEHVKYLSGTIRERSADFEGALGQTTDYLKSQLSQMGYTVVEQTYMADGQPMKNLEVELVGSDKTAGEIVLGAHYDSVEGTVGANDNASGVAATLELARLLRSSNLRRTVRFVFFVNEEPPFFQTEKMGSLVYAKKLRHDGGNVAAMISLETIGYYSDEPGSQKYPSVLRWFYPSQGNFIGFVGNTQSSALVRRAVRRFRQTTAFPSEGVAAPEETA